MNARYVTTPRARRPRGFGDWLDALLPGATVTTDALEQITATLEAQCAASGGKVVGTRCEFLKGGVVNIPQPEDVVPGVAEARAKAEQTVAALARQGASTGAESGAGRAIVIGALLVAGTLWLLKHKR